MNKIDLNEYEVMQDELLEKEQMVFHNTSKKKSSDESKLAEKSFRDSRKNRHNNFGESE